MAARIGISKLSKESKNKILFSSCLPKNYQLKFDDYADNEWIIKLVFL